MAKKRLKLKEVTPKEIMLHLSERISKREKAEKFLKELTRKGDPIYLGSWDGEVRMVVGKKLVYSKCMKGDKFDLSYGVTLCVRKLLRLDSLLRFKSGAKIKFPAWVEEFGEINDHKMDEIRYFNAGYGNKSRSAMFHLLSNPRMSGKSWVANQCPARNVPLEIATTNDNFIQGVHIPSGSTLGKVILRCPLLKKYISNVR